MSDASVGNPAQTASIETITDQVLELIESGTPTPIILVDGRTGSGKTTFAAALQNRLFQKGESAPRVIHMDDLYEGWDGLQAGVLVVHDRHPQALGGGGIMVSIFSINADLFEPRERARYQSYSSLVLMASGALGPVLGGTLSAIEGVRPEDLSTREGFRVVAAVAQDDEALLGESADLVFHLIVLLRSRGLGLDAVEALLRQRHAAKR